MAKPIRMGPGDPKAMKKLRENPDNVNVFGIRVTNGQKADIYERAIQLQKKLNDSRQSGQPEYRFNDVIISAIYLGLEQLRKKQ